MLKKEVPVYILENALDAIRMAANTLESRERKTAMDRQIEYSERLLKWVLSDQTEEAPRWVPSNVYSKDAPGWVPKSDKLDIDKAISIIESQTKEIQELKNGWAVDKASLKLYYELHKINDKLREK